MTVEHVQRELRQRELRKETECRACGRKICSLSVRECVTALETFCVKYYAQSQLRRRYFCFCFSVYKLSAESSFVSVVTPS